MDACNSYRFKFFGCDDYITFSLHHDCQHGDMIDFKLKISDRPHDFEIKSFYTGYTLLQVAAINNCLEAFQSRFNCYSSSYYGIAYIASIAGHGKSIMQSMKYFEGINLNVLHYITSTCSSGDPHDEHISMFAACLDGNFSCVRSSIKNKGIIKDSFGHTALHLACLNGNLMGIEDLLLQHSKDCQNKELNTPLHLSCIQGNVGVVKYLVNTIGCNTEIENCYGYKPLHVACQYGNIEIVKFLVEHLNVHELDSFIDSTGKTLLHHATYKMSDVRVSKYLVDVHCLDPFYSDSNNLTPIHLACRNGMLEIANYLSSIKVPYHPYFDNKGKAPLHEACMYGHLEIVKHLTHESHSMHKDVYCYDCDGFTPLQLACKHGHFDIVQYFINEYKWDEPSRSHYKQDLLHLACQFGHLEMVQYLVKDSCAETKNSNKSDAKNTVHELDSISNTPLHYASKHGHLDIVQYLVSLSKSELLVKNVINNTPLHLAARYNQVHVVKYFLENNYYNCDIKGEKGRTSLFLAAFYKCKDCFEYLLNIHKQCKFLVVDNEDESILPCIYKWNKPEIAKIVVEALGHELGTCTYESTIVLYSAIGAPLKTFKAILELIANKEKITKTKVLRMHRDTAGNTVLHSAISLGNIDVVQYVLREIKLDITTINNNGQSCVEVVLKQDQNFIATCFKDSWKYIDSERYKESLCTDTSENQDVQSLKLLNMCKYLSEVDCNDCTPLHIACQSGELEVVKNMSENYTYFFKCDYAGRTPLHTACMNGHLNIVKFFNEVKELKSEWSHCDHDSNTAFHLAVQYDKVQIISYILDNNLNSINSKGEGGKTPLMMSCFHYSYETLKYLIGKYSKIDHSLTDCDGKTALWYICTNNNEGIINDYITASPHHTEGNYKQKALYYAIAEKGQFKAFKLICKMMEYHSVSLLEVLSHEFDKNGNSLLHLACKYGHLDIVRFLIKKVKFISNLLNNEGQTCLNLAMIHYQVEIVEFLVNNATNLFFLPTSSGQALCLYDSMGTNIEEQNEILSIIVNKHQDKYILLLHAASEGHADILRHFLSLTASELNMSCRSILINVTDSLGNTALHLAIASKHLKVIQYLTEEVKLSLSMSNNYGNTCLDLLLEYNYSSLKYLTENWQRFYTEDDDYTEFHSDHNNEFKILKCLKMCKNLNHYNKKGYHPLHVACRHGHLGIVKFLTSNSHNVFIVDNQGFTPMHTACRYGHLHIVQYLMDDKNVTIEDINGNIPIFTACQYGHLDIVKKLCQHKMLTSNFKLDGYNLVLCIGCKYGYKDIVKFCVEKLSLNPYISSNSSGLTPLHFASMCGHLNIIKLLLLEEVPSPIDYKGYIPLHYASQNGCLEVVKYLVLTKRSELLNTSTDNQTALHVAVCHDQMMIVKYFLEHNLYDPNLKDGSGKTPLILAAIYESYDTLKYLISDSSLYDHSITDDNGKTAFSYIYDNDREDVLEYIINGFKNCSIYKIKGNSYKIKALLYLACEKGLFSTFYYVWKSLEIYSEESRQFICDNTDDYRNTALHLACMNGCIEAVRYIIEELVISPNIVNEDGDTCFHLATKFGQTCIVRYLCSIESNILCRNKYGSTPLHTACQYGLLEIVKCLYTSNSESLLDNLGRNPFHIANTYGHLEIVQFFFTQFHLNSFLKDDIKCLTPVDYDCTLNEQEVCHYLDMPDCSGYTPLHHASKNGHLNVVQYLVLKSKSMLLYRDCDNNTPLHIAVRHNQIEVVHYFVEHKLYDSNIQGENGMNPIFLAAFYKCNETLDYLFINYHETAIQIKDNNGLTLLAYLFMRNRLDIIKNIISLSACNTIGKDDICQIVLYCATDRGHFDSFCYILDEIADSSDCTPLQILHENMDSYNNTALHLASRYGNIEAVKYIFDIGHDPNALNCNDQSCFYKASEHGQLGIIQYLCSTSADPFIKDKNGMNALEIATKNGHLEIVDYLFSKYSDTIQESFETNSISCLHLASQHGHLLIVKLLTRKYQCNPLLYDQYGLTALHRAAQNGSLAVIEYLIKNFKFDY